MWIISRNEIQYFQSFILTSDSLLSIHYFPNWNEPIQVEALGGRNYQPTFSYSSCCNVVYVSPQQITLCPSIIVSLRLGFFILFFSNKVVQIS